MTVYQPTKSLALRFLKVPEGPPDAPAGSHGSVHVFRASPKYLRYKLLLATVGLLPALFFEGFAAVAALAGLGLAGIPIAIVIVLLLLTTAGFGFFATRVEYDVRYYIVTDRSLRVRTGAWIVREMTLTYANVQNLRVVQGPLQRLFGISDIAVDTAGGGGAVQARGGHQAAGHHVEIAGIENPAEVRDLILSHMRARAAGSGLGDPDDATATAVPAPAPAAAGPEFLAALREVRDAARAFERAAASR